MTKERVEEIIIFGSNFGTLQINLLVDVLVEALKKLIKLFSIKEVKAALAVAECDM